MSFPLTKNCYFAMHKGFYRLTWRDEETSENHGGSRPVSSYGPWINLCLALTDEETASAQRFIHLRPAPSMNFRK